MDSDEQPGSRLGEDLRRMFLERGYDFFNQDEEQRQAHKPADDQGGASQSKDTVKQPSDGQTAEATSPEALSNMRLEILPQLQYVRVAPRLLIHRLNLPSIALGEMTLAKDVLSLFAASTAHTSFPSAPHADPSSVSVPPSDLLASSSVSQLPSIASVQSFNARLVAGGKDEALRKASELFKVATIAVERGHDVGARYWIDALKIRRRNWGLTPAPLAFGMPTGRGADRTTKDFLISFGLSECMLFPRTHTQILIQILQASPGFRQRATGQLATYGSKESIAFPRRQRTILCVSVMTMDASGTQRAACNTIANEPRDDDPLQTTLHEAQREVLEQEIFSLLIRNASILPTSSVRVAERLLVVEATQDTEIRFELVSLHVTLPSILTDRLAQYSRSSTMGLHLKRWTLIPFREPDVI